MTGLERQVLRALGGIKDGTCGPEALTLQHLSPIPQGAAVLAWKRDVQSAVNRLIRAGHIKRNDHGLLVLQ